MAQSSLIGGGHTVSTLKGDVGGNIFLQQVGAWCMRIGRQLALAQKNTVSMIVFFTNLMHKFFILIHLLRSSTCFEHYCAPIREDSCISTTSVIVTFFRWHVQTTGYERTGNVERH